MPKIAVKFIVDQEQKAVVRIEQTNSPPIKCQMVKADEKNRRIVRVLRKYLDLQLTVDQLQVFDKSDFVVLGELLYELAFNDDNAKSALDYFYRKSIENQEEASFDIFLEFEKATHFEDLAILPWEYMFYKPKDRLLQSEVVDPFLAADANKKINFYRKYPSSGLFSMDFLQFAISSQRPLKILLIIANPWGSQPLQMKMDVLFLFDNLVQSHPGLIDIRYLPQPNYDQDILSYELKNGRPFQFGDQDEEKDHPIFKMAPYHLQDDDIFQPDIIHFVGRGKTSDKHGLYGLVRQEEQQALEGELSDEKFASCLSAAGLNPKLVFLQTNNGGRVVNLEQDGGMAPQLLKNKVPFVIAMQNPIQEKKALDFTRIFYDELLSGADIGKAVTAGRFRLGQYSGITETQNYAHKGFGTPVLFTTVDFPMKVIVEKQTTTTASRGTATHDSGLQAGKVALHQQPESAKQGVSYLQPDLFGLQNAKRSGGQSLADDSPESMDNGWDKRLQEMKSNFLFYIDTNLEQFFEVLVDHLVTSDKLQQLSVLEQEYRMLKTLTFRRSSSNLGRSILDIKLALITLVNSLNKEDIKANKFNQ